MPIRNLSLYREYFVLLSSLLIFFSCSKDNNNSKGSSKFMVIYASPGAPNADVLVNNQVVSSTPLAYPGNTEYREIPAGNATLQLNQAGTSNQIYDALLTVPANITFTNILYGNYGAGVESLLVEDVFNLPPGGKAYVRFFQLSPGAPKLDLVFEQSGNLNRLFPSRNYENTFSVDSTRDFVTINTGTYNLQARVTSADVLIFQKDNFSFEEGKVYTIYMNGVLNSSTTPADFQVLANR